MPGVNEKDDLAALPNAPAQGGGGFALAASEVSEKQRLKRETTEFYGGVSLEEFARRLGLSGDNVVRTLKRWIEKGREVKPVDLPPFQRPGELAGWWRRMQAAGVMEKRPPEWMQLLEQTAVGKVPGTAEAAGQAGTPAPAGAPAAPESMPPEFTLPDLDPNAGDAEKQLWSFAKGFLDEMGLAARVKDTKRWYSAWNEYRKILAEIRAWQKSRQKDRLANGEVLEATKEMEVLTVVFSSLSKTFTTSLLTMAKRLQPELDELQARNLVLPFRDKIFAALKKHRFLQALPAELVTALAA